MKERILLLKKSFDYSHIFIFTTLLTFIVFLMNAIRSHDLSLDFLGWLYFVFAALGFAAILSLILFILFFQIPLFISKKIKLSIFTYVTIAIIFQLFLITDNITFCLYKYHIDSYVINLLLKGGSDIFVFDFYTIAQFILIVILLAIVPYAAYLRFYNKIYTVFTVKIRKIIFLIFSTCFLIIFIGYAIAKYNKQDSIPISVAALPFFNPKPINTLLVKFALMNLDEIDKILFLNPKHNIKYPAHPLICNDSIPNYNIVFLVIDSWNPTTFDKVVTPNLFHFAENKCQIFKQHYSSSNATFGSIYGLFFGIPCLYEKETTSKRIYPAFIDRLGQEDYDIQTFPSADFAYPPFHQMIYGKYPDIMIKNEGNTAFDKDNIITDKFIDYLDKKKNNKKFFSFLFYDLPHAISIPKEYRKKFQPTWDEANYLALNNNMDKTPFFNLYKNCVYHIDSLAGKVIKTLEKKKLLDNTIIIITGDHGQEFNENKMNFWGHRSNYSEWQLRVPLIVYYPSIEKGKHFTHTTTHYDITAMLMKHFLGVENQTADYTLGFDLYDTRSRYPLIAYDLETSNALVYEDKTIYIYHHFGFSAIVDNQFNQLPRTVVNTDSLQKTMDKINSFYTSQ